MPKRSRRPPPHAVHVRYLPGYVEGGPWQMAVINCGNEVVPAGYVEYPYREDEAMHPSGYFHTWDEGRVLDDYQILIAARTWRATAREELLNKAKLTLLARSQEEVDLAALAKELGLSYSSFRRAFRASTGQPPRQYLLAIRINRAKALLQESGRKIGAIASAVGFSSAALREIMERAKKWLRWRGGP